MTRGHHNKVACVQRISVGSEWAKTNTCLCCVLLCLRACVFSLLVSLRVATVLLIYYVLLSDQMWLNSTMIYRIISLFCYIMMFLLNYGHLWHHSPRKTLILFFVINDDSACICLIGWYSRLVKFTACYLWLQ